MSATGLGFWPAVRLVARREMVERARDRSFIVSTLFTLGIVVLAVVLPVLAGFGEPATYRVGFAGDASGSLVAAARTQAAAVAVDLRPAQIADPAAARTLVAGGELDALVQDDRVLVEQSLPGELAAVLDAARQQVRTSDRLQAAGLDPQEAAAALEIEPLQVAALDPPDPGADVRRQVAFIATFILYGQLIGYGMWVALGVVEEKSSRVVEVLLATVRPRALLTGKILGIGALGLGQLTVVALVGVAAGVAAGAVELGGDVLVPIAAVVGWFVLGYGFYATLFAAAAARVSRQEDLQNVTTPTTMLVVISFFGALYAVNEPAADVARVMSIIPPFSALMSPLLMAAGEVGVGQVTLAVILMLTAIAGLVVVAARTYEGAILRMGSKISWREAWARR